MTGMDHGASGRTSAASGSGPTGRGPVRPPVSPTELAGFGVQFVVSVLLFLYLGRWLDGKLHTAPLLLILGAFVGAGAAFFSLYRKLTGKPGGRGAS